MPSTAKAAASDSGNGRRGLMHSLMLAGTFFWAANIIAGKVALRSMSALALAQVRVTAGGIIFLALIALRRHRLPFRLSRLTRRDWRTLGLTALFGITLNQLLFIGGIGRTSAAHAGLIVALGPVMVLILACVLRLEAWTPLKVVGAAISFGGVAVLTIGKAEPGSTANWAGDLILMGGSAVFAYYTILLKKIARRLDALNLNAILFVLGGLLMLPFGGRAVGRVRWTTLAPEAWWALAFIVSCGTVLAYLIYAFALTELTATRVAAFAYLQPVIAAALGVWLLGETLTARVMTGGALILFGVYLTEREFQGPVAAGAAAGQVTNRGEP